MTGALLVAILAAIVGLALLAKKLHVPYPVVFVLGGIVLALIPGVPRIELRPELVFLLFLPALIFGDGWTTDYPSFKRFYQPIFMLAIGLVGFTSLVVAFAAQWMMGFPLALGFVLGAILSPTDAVATDAIAEEVPLPRQLMTIISGESLVNDATGLVIYRFAVLAVATGTFSLLHATLQFVYVVVAGVAVGLGIAWLITQISVAIRKAGLSDELIAVSISLVTPFALYVPADAIGASGVLAAMAGGIYMSRKSAQIFDADSRIAAAYTWNLLFFVFNGAAFVLIGLQLPSIVRALAAYSLLTVIGWSLAIALIVVLVRYAWVFPAAFGRRRLFPQIRRREGPDPTWQQIFVLGTAGMRGIVSLAAALGLPETIAPGIPFPQRNLILFITFVVILVTLVGEGLAMPWLIRRLGVTRVENEDRAVAAARVRLAEAGRAHLRTLESSFASTAEWEIAGRLHAYYEMRVSHYTAHADGTEPDDDAQQHEIERRLRREAFDAERRVLQEMRRGNEVAEDVYRHLQWDLDLAESQLE
ncbi:MAG TPA: Na+/H+ antiporter [Candidatus Elarobacter sp.]|nr:Na+/H+ antiporter [Candidatus Elarobacter sp.]